MDDEIEAESCGNMCKVTVASWIQFSLFSVLQIHTFDSCNEILIDRILLQDGVFQQNLFFIIELTASNHAQSL